MRLFEIPVYAFDKDALNLKVRTYDDKIGKSLRESVSKNLINKAVESDFLLYSLQIKRQNRFGLYEYK